MKPIRLDVAPTGLREVFAVQADDVRGVVEARAVNERRAHAVDVDRHAERLEAPDLLRVEASGRDDPHVPVPGLVERGAQQLDQTGRDAARVAVAGDAFLLLELAYDREIHQRL